ncbi:MAG TPA: hypothetical protein VN457_07985, partial [Chlamydiales bacterium]|nr:hypothetical protein [Chlamydiales bacterium]
QLACDIVNTIAKVTVKRSSDFNQAQLREAYQYFLKDLDAQRRVFDQATLELAQFRTENEYGSSDPESLPILTKLTALEAKMQETTLEYNGLAVRYENLLRQMSEMPEQIARYSYESSPLKIRLDRSQMALLEARTRYAPDNPKVKLLEREINEIQKMLEEETKNKSGYKVFESNPMKEKTRVEIMNMQSLLRVAQRLRDDIQAELDGNRKELQKLPQKQAEFARLTNKKATSQEMVRNSENVIKTIELMMASGQGDVELYQLAEKAEAATSPIS